MFYCKYCSDTLEITKNVNQSVEENIQPINDATELFHIVIDDIEFKKNKFINSDVQFSINWAESLIDDINLKDLVKTVKLNNDITVDELKLMIIAKYRQIVKSQKNISQFFLLCTNCATTYFLEPGTIIESINYEKSIINIENDSHIRVNDPTLPRTKDFICPNQKCVNNTKKTDRETLIQKEAVFYRNSKEYNIRYICCQCNAVWGT